MLRFKELRKKKEKQADEIYEKKSAPKKTKEQIWDPRKFSVNFWEAQINEKRRKILNQESKIQDESFKVASQSDVPELCDHSHLNNHKRENTHCDLTERCKVERNYEPADFNTKNRLGFVKINQELVAHGHPSSRKGMNVDKRKEELKQHYIHFHNQKFD